MIVADTSIWIECFRDPSSVWGEELRQLVLESRVACNGIILCEVLQGARSNSEFQKLNEAMKVLEFREVNREVWDVAANVAFHCHLKNQKIPLSDSVIAALCLYHKDELVSLDKHFQIIAKNFPLKLRVR